MTIGNRRLTEVRRVGRRRRSAARDESQTRRELYQHAKENYCFTKVEKPQVRNAKRIKLKSIDPARRYRRLSTEPTPPPVLPPASTAPAPTPIICIVLIFYNLFCNECHHHRRGSRWINTHGLIITVNTRGRPHTHTHYATHVTH